MSEKRFYLENDEWVKYEYSEIREHVDEKHISIPLRNDELCKLLNELYEENQRLRNDCSILVQSNQEYRKENEQLKERNEKLQWELDKTREDLNYFANLKAGAMRRSDCRYNRCYVTSMQKRDDEDDN